MAIKRAIPENSTPCKHSKKLFTGDIPGIVFFSNQPSKPTLTLKCLLKTPWSIKRATASAVNTFPDSDKIFVISGYNNQKVRLDMKAKKTNIKCNAMLKTLPWIAFLLHNQE